MGTSRQARALCSKPLQKSHFLAKKISALGLPRRLLPQFPLCHLHANNIQIILRRSPLSTVVITINPDKFRPEHEQDKLKSFSSSLDDFTQLPSVIEEATREMGIGVGGGINSGACSRDVLSVEITGPDRPQLSVYLHLQGISTANILQNGRQPSRSDPYQDKSPRGD